MDQSDRAYRCPRCGSTLSPDAHEGLCPACLLAAGSEPLSHASGEQSTMLPSSHPEKGLRPLFSGGERFGPYRIERLLGRGGMGDVYEAEQIEQGRRVAIKVLSQRLNDPQDRARFLREGQLAASISHPHSVYIFGSEEITGVPVIAMELLPGGTLKDRVARGGPMRPADAVDAILQVIAGLDAAQAAGILHRDIKPSNCFIDSAGDVKVGDFGLSISTLARDASPLTMVGTFQGTPQFAAPEQLRGEPLDLRADIYAVGATLFYLLTGHPPFDDRDLMTLLSRIATEPPTLPRSPDIPRGLAAIVLRCLAKDRAQRPASYAALDDALRPFGSAASVPAGLGLRLLAGMIDGAIVSAVMVPLTALWMRNDLEVASLRLQFVVQMAFLLSYYGLSEGRWGASIGKRICRLRVATETGHVPGAGRAILRAAVFHVPHIAAAMPGVIFGTQWVFRNAAHPLSGWVVMLPYYLAQAAMFSTMRRRNGLAGLHDLASGTRVVERRERADARLARESSAPRAEITRAQGQFGPFTATGVIGATNAGRLLLGFDPGLRRNVWIHVQAPGAPPVNAARRDISRAGRLRWLNGHRSASEAWDAYEAIDGSPIATALDHHQPWRRVKYWLLDLAIEIDRSVREGSLPPLTLSRVWLTGDGRARLLDFPVAPGAEDDEPSTFADATRLLSHIADRALKSDGPLPVSAGALLADLRAGSIADPGSLASALQTLADRPDRVERWRRATHLGLTAAPAVLMTLITFLTMVIAPRMIAKDSLELSVLLSQASTLPVESKTDRAQRDALDEYLSGRFGPTLKAFQSGQGGPTLIGMLSPQRETIARILASYPEVSADRTAADAALLEPLLKRVHDSQREFSQATPSLFVTQAWFFLAVTAVFGMLSSWIFRGGWLLHALGIAVVANGAEASRMRTLWRGLVAWTAVPVVFYLAPPLVFMVIDFHFSDNPIRLSISLLLSGLFVAGAVSAIAHPTRGWQDRLAGTWLVPR